MTSKAAILFVIMPGVYNDYTPISPIHLTGLPIEKIQEKTEQLLAEDIIGRIDELVGKKDVWFIWLANDMGVVHIETAPHVIKAYGFNVKYEPI
jgi:hypothetical protein